MTEVPADGIFSVHLPSWSERGPLSVTRYPWKRMPASENISDLSSTDLFNNGVNINIKTSCKHLDVNIRPFNQCLPGSEVDADSSSRTTNISSVSNQVNSPKGDDAAPLGLNTILDMTAAQRAIAERFIDVLGQAVRIRIGCQAPLCHRCLRRRMARDCGALVAERNIGALVAEQECGASVAERDSGALVTERDSGTQVAIREQSTCGHTRVAILFSGGIDCMMIAALADR